MATSALAQGAPSTEPAPLNAPATETAPTTAAPAAAGSAQPAATPATAPPVTDPRAPAPPSSLFEIPAREAPRERRPPQPHDGVMWRLALGVSYAHGWYGADRRSLTLSTFPAASVGVSLGVALMPGLVAQMDLSFTRGSASYSSDGDTVQEVDLTCFAVGPGLTYWLPDDWFLGGGLMLGQVSTVSGTYRITIEIPDIDSTDVGAGLHANVGKQWRVGQRWGIGPMIELWLLALPQPAIDAEALKVFGMSFTLTATYD